MEAIAANSHYAQVGKAIPVAIPPSKNEAPEGLTVARRSFLDELPGAVIGFATIAYIVTSLLALA